MVLIFFAQLYLKYVLSVYKNLMFKFFIIQNIILIYKCAHFFTCIQVDNRTGTTGKATTIRGGLHR